MRVMNSGSQTSIGTSRSCAGFWSSSTRNPCHKPWHSQPRPRFCTMLLGVDAEDRFWVVDWDETLLAPKECDLMFGVGGIGGEFIGPQEEAWFLKDYGSTAIDPVAL